MSYIPLYTKTDYSLLSSLITIDDYISFAINNNINTLALTDENTISGAIEFYQKCLKNNIKPIIGMEVTIDSYKIVLYSKNKEGYTNLSKLSTTLSYTKINIEDLKKYKTDLICIIPFKYKEIYKELKEIYIETYIGFKNEDEKLELLKETSNIVYINETLYINEYDDIYLKYANLIRDGKKKEEINNYNYDKNYLIEPHKINKEYYKKTLEITNNIDLKLETNEIHIPKYKNDKNVDSSSYLIELSRYGLNKRLKNKVTKKYADRLMYELEVITSLKFEDYFLIVADYIKYAKKEGIYVGVARGSAASSLVSYSLGITDVDPLEHDLLFERFLNKERITMPDIDIDFEDERREEVIEYVTKKYGEKQVAKIITYGTLSSKLILRDISRVFDLPVKLVDKINSYINPKEDLYKNIKTNKRLEELINSSKDLKEMYKIAMKLENKKRHASTHAAGVVISDVEIDNIAPLVKIDDSFTVGYTMNYLEDLGLLKMDFLGLKNLTIIKNIINDIKKYENKEINLNEIKFDDKEVLKLFYDVKTEGIFQFESEGIKNFLYKLKITSFDDVIAAVALYRPGPMDNIPLYIENKNKLSKINYIHESLKPILEKTYGVIIYQEQIMQISNIMASYTLGEADILRRAISKKKKEVILNEKERFIERSIKNNYDKETAVKVFDLILRFADYGFNKAHSVSYAIIAYQMAYLKTYYKKYFYLNLLNNYVSSEVKLKEYIKEMKKENITIKLPNINYSDYYFTIHNGEIIYGLSILKGLGINTVNEILKEREKSIFIDYIDFISRTLSKNINKKAYETLIYGHTLNDFENHNTLLYNLENVVNYSTLIKDLNKDFVLKPNIEKLIELQEDDLLKKELEVYGFYINNSPVIKYRDNDITTDSLRNYFDRKIHIYLKVEKVKTIKTKKNDDMCFITGSDEDGEVEIIVFSDTFKELSDIFKEDIIKVEGKVEKRNANYQIIAQKIEKIDYNYNR